LLKVSVVLFLVHHTPLVKSWPVLFAQNSPIDRRVYYCFLTKILPWSFSVMLLFFVIEHFIRNWM
jgi:hypothetical protein